MRLILGFTASLLLMVGGARADGSYMLDQLQNLKMVDQYTASTSDRGKLDYLEAEAFAVGNAAGAFWAAGQINAMLNSMANYLDVTFDFNDVMIRYKGMLIVPPVIVETKNYTQLSGAVGREARIDRLKIDIISEPRFTLEPVTWRNYLLLSPEKPRPPSQDLLPKTSEEQKVWKAKVLEGWKTGEQQAVFFVINRYYRLTRDLVGMDYYHILKSAKIVTEPIVDHKYEPVMGGGYSLSIEHSVVRIDVNPQLVADRHAWRSIPQLPDVSDLFPRGLFNLPDVTVVE